MKKADLFFAAVFGLLCFAAPAAADTDYQCLNRCVNLNGGGKSAPCLASCTYNKRVETLRSSKVSSSHRVFNAPVPVKRGQVFTSESTPRAPDKDYSCMSQCVSNRVSYAFCEERCAKGSNSR